MNDLFFVYLQRKLIELATVLHNSSKNNMKTL